MTLVSDEGSRRGASPAWKKQPLWETCDHTLFDFSPSGDEESWPVRRTWTGSARARPRCSTRTARWSAEWHSAGQAALLHTIWEDDDHVLALVFQDDTWAILRLDVTDGSVELAVEPVPDQAGRTPFVLPVR